MTDLPDLLTDPSSPPPAPATVAGARSLALWTEITSRYALRADELILLEHAARLVGVCDHLAQQLVGESLIVKGSMGQPAPHPLLGELRAHRSQLAALLKQLQLPDEMTDAAQPGDAIPFAVSERARKAARSRWIREKGGA